MSDFFKANWHYFSLMLSDCFCFALDINIQSKAWIMHVQWFAYKSYLLETPNRQVITALVYPRYTMHLAVVCVSIY
ncbi:hypothetical protein AB3Y13_04600 [Vibrio alginolyticus]